MTEKDNASMTTVQMKADYAASEVYSTASEPPPAYKRQSNSVKIAKITAFTIIVSSFVLGSFILASTYLQARASCDQVQALDSVLEKELMLETLQQVNKELPRAEALMGRELNTDNDLQTLDKEGKEGTVKMVELKTPKAPIAEEETSVNDSTYTDKEEIEETQKYPGKLPLELDLSDLAAALLQNNKKSRMNCVVERKHAEELVDSPSKTVALPFGMNLTTDPKKARITGERISIFCEGGNENKEQDNTITNKHREDDDEGDDETEVIRPMFIPIQRLPIPFGRIPPQYPLTHMPQRMMPPQMQPQYQIHQQQSHMQPQIQTFLRELPSTPTLLQQLPMRPPMPPQVMQAPPQQNEPQQRIVRIHVQQIPIREVIHSADDVPIQITSPHMTSDGMQRAIHQAQSYNHVQPQQQQQQQQQIPQAPLQLQLQRLFGQQPQRAPQQLPQPITQQRQEMPLLQIQRMPLGMALERAGITPEDLANIQRMTEERMNDVLRHLTNDSDEDGSNSSEEDDDETPNVPQSTNEQEKAQVQQQQQQQQQQEQAQQQQQQQQQSERQARMQQMPVQRLILQPLPEQPRDTMTPPMPDQTMTRLPMTQTQSYGRSLAQPVRIPVPMMQDQADLSSQDEHSAPVAAPTVIDDDSARPHFVQPRSV